MSTTTTTTPPPPKKKKATPVSSHGRSVVDFVTSEELDKALESVTTAEEESDWRLPIPDPEAEEQTHEGELQRLLTLKSYMLLDAEKEQVFDDLTLEAREVFGVPTSLISLIDLGRQFLFSNTGAGGVRETSRKVAFCSHTILNKKNMLVVGDTKEDDRFKNSELVNDGPKLRFYAGTPLISPEGHKLGTFCVEGPEPRPQGLNEMEQKKLKDYAAKTVELMVERRKKLRDRLSSDTVSTALRKHAGVATSLGDIMYAKGDYETAMRLYQESVQTVMYVEEDGMGAKAPEERQEAMVQLLTLLSVQVMPDKNRKEFEDKIAALYGKPPSATTKEEHEKKPTTSATVMDGIPGLFSVSKSTSMSSSSSSPQPSSPLPCLFFNEVFRIDFGDMLSLPDTDTRPLDEVPFTVPLEECSKATLFNMGQVHYNYWGNQETALQFFHLAASVSHKISPLAFDPIDLGCVNNMAQIHLQYGQPDDALKMLHEALERGNRTLAAMYRQTEPEEVGNDDDDMDKSSASSSPPGMTTTTTTDDNDDLDARRTRRLRQKLARTLINIGHVHFYNRHYDDSLARCQEALKLVDSKMGGITLAAIWYNMSINYFYQRQFSKALTHINKFLDLSIKLNGPNHLQTADALYRKAKILFEMGKFQDCMEPIQEALRIRQACLGNDHIDMAELHCLAGKISLALDKYDPALESLLQSLKIQRKAANNGEELTFDAAQVLLEIARTHHAKGDVKDALDKYLQVLDWTQKFFGPSHPFVARINGIVGNLYMESGQIEESKPFLAKVTQIQEQLVQNTA